MRTCVIFNPAAKGDKARRFRRHLDLFGSGCDLVQTTAAGDARRLAAGAVQAGADTVVAAGGDGTLNEVLNGMGDVPDGFDRARLGVLPLGTINVFARELGIPTRLERAWEIIRSGRETRVDLPRVEFSGGGGRERRYFAQLAGAGLDARAIELVDWSLKKKVGPFAYILAGLRALRGAQVGITVDDGRGRVTGELVLIGNGRLYGGPFRLFPGADLRDGLLDVCVFPRVNWFTLAWCGPRLLMGLPPPAGLTRRLRAASIKLSSAPSAAMEVDGELAGHLPANFSVQRSALRVIVSSLKPKRAI